ncbi:MAG: BspA family leucine-rich repeat surface protein [Vagococcus sp.]|uniref:BspA family leucine-rich repeat surface protein n=1 Tax=Vagococcus TaxID=2737 RepID=UPI002FCC8926
MKKQKDFLFVLECFVFILFLVGLQRTVVAEKVIEDNLYVAYSKVNPSFAIDISRNDQASHYEHLIMYGAHGRGNQLLGYQYRPEKDGYIIYASENEQRILQAQQNNLVKAINFQEPINNYTEFSDDYIWDIKKDDKAGYYKIASRSNKGYITAKSISNNGEVRLESERSSSYQSFRLETINGMYQIRSVSERSKGWDIEGGTAANKQVIAYDLYNQNNQKWLILFKPNDDGYVISNNDSRNLITNHRAGATNPTVINNKLTFDQKYPDDSIFYFQSLGFDIDGKNIKVKIQNKRAPTSFYQKDNQIATNTVSRLFLQGSSTSYPNRQQWILDKIDDIPVPKIDNLIITSQRPEAKDFFYIGEKLTLTGDYIGTGFSSYDLYSKFDIAEPTLLQKGNPIPSSGVSHFKTEIDTSEYAKEGERYIEIFARADSMFQSNRVAQKYNMIFPTPTGKPVPQAIKQGTALSTLKATDFVTDLNDEMSNNITVDKEIKELDPNKVGVQMAKITIRNQYKETVIEVPVTVGLYWGEVPGYFDETTGELIFTGSGTLGESIVAPWNNGNIQKATDVKSITFTQPVKAPENSSYLFSSNQLNKLINVESINGLNLLDTSSVKKMDSMFFYLAKLKEIDVSHFDTSKVTTMNRMFANVSNISEINLESFDTVSSKTDTSFMFSGSSNIKQISLGKKTKLSKSDLVQPKKVANNYTGNWQGVGEGTIEKPTGEFVGSVAELETLTQDTDKRINETYVWEPVTISNVTINYYQKGTQKKIVEKLDEGSRKEPETKNDIVYEHKQIADMLESLGIDIEPTYDGYSFLEKETKIQVTNTKEELDLVSKFPREDIVIDFYFDSTVQFSYPESIDFGNRPQSKYENIYQMKPSDVEEENYLSIIDTIETNQDEPDWTLSMSTTGFYHADSGVRLLADLMLTLPDNQQPIMITSEGIPIVENSNNYKKDISLSSGKKNEGLAVRVSKVDKLGQYNGVLKYQLQVVP